MDNYKNHSWAPFEGYYTRVDLESGSSLIFIICTVPNAQRRAHNITLTYVNSDGQIWQHEEFPHNSKFEQFLDGNGFRFVHFQENSTLSLNAAPDQTTIIDKVGNDINVQLNMKDFTFWSSRSPSLFNPKPTSPEKILNYLPLPLHWHVYSLQSACKAQLSLPADARMNPADADSTGLAHQEKNWAMSFPPAHIWLQARQPGHGISLAGGKTMGQQAFLMGYRNDAKGLEVDFRPPFAMKFFNIWGPFMSTTIDWESRVFELDVSDFTTRMVVKASAPKGTFYSLSGPFPDGHRHNWLAQSLRGTVSVEVYKRRGWWPFGGWELVCTDVLDKCGLEFGGEYYPHRGEGKAGVLEIH